MTQFNNQSEIIAGLQASSQAITEASNRLPMSDFIRGTDTQWSPADYLKHLILSVKPFASALKLPHDQLDDLFGKATRSSMTDRSTGERSANFIYLINLTMFVTSH